MATSRTLLIPILLLGLAQPVTATTSFADPKSEDQPLTFEETLRGLWEKMGPELEKLKRDMEPALEDALKLLEPFSAMDDPRNYQMPEILPNGDIIIRRREDAPDYVPRSTPEATPDPEKPIKT